ncbi:MAG: hypothetical protein LBM13_04675, partial [Candidatus Ancillula sp.]|nr:hypothetical protein [Candidatus Ancillula sp.]
SFIKGVGYTGISLPLSVYGYSGTADYSAYITIYNVDASKNYNSDSLDLKSSLEASVASQDSATRSNVSISNLRDFYVDDDLNDNLAVQQPLYFASRNQTYIMKFDHGDYRWQFPTGTWFSDREIQGLDDIVNSL